MQQLTGLSRTHLAPFEAGVWLHLEVVEPLRQLRAAAAREGIELAVASGFRDFDRQLTIWNGKASGQRPVFSADGAEPLDLAMLSEEELMYAILRWSALPGTSRHHWGTDMDVWDAAAVDPGYRLQLAPAEYAADGPFAHLAAWLASGAPESFGFFRPYSRDRGGVSPEAWHISYRPLAAGFGDAFDFHQLAEHLETTDITLKDAIASHLEMIERRFFYR